MKRKILFVQQKLCGGWSCFCFEPLLLIEVLNRGHFISAEANLSSSGKWNIFVTNFSFRKFPGDHAIANWGNKLTYIKISHSTNLQSKDSGQFWCLPLYSAVLEKFLETLPYRMAESEGQKNSRQWCRNSLINWKCMKVARKISKVRIL